jgi:kynureninase
VALEVQAGAREVHESLARAGVVTDFRPPDVIRLCPEPLYNSYHEVWRTVQHLA